MHEQTQFCRTAFPWTIPIEWQGKVGIHRIDAERLARIELSEGYGIPTHQHYVGMTVAIQHVRTGRIATEFFAFNVALSDVPRSDTRHDQEGKDYRVIAYVGWHWYIHHPLTTEPFVAAVESYIDQFRLPGESTGAKYAFVCDTGASGLPQVLIVADSEEEIVRRALEVFDREGAVADDEEWSFWVDTTAKGLFDKLGHADDRDEIEHFFD